MIIVVAALAAVLSVPLTGGSLARLAKVSFVHVWLVWAAVLAQMVITIAPGFPDALGRPLHIATFVLAALFMWLNRRLPGVLLVAIGAGFNLAAITANGGTMPASAAAWRTAGLRAAGDGFSNSNVIANARLPWLGDIFAIPKGLPFANVFSVGDVVVVVAVAYFVHASCRRTVTAIA
jgi:hypothetical protein